MGSVKGNIILNGINTITGIIFPVVTFPYAARILLPDGIGAVNFLNSIVNYIILLTSLGIPMYAVKEVAKYRDDEQQRNKITIEILILSAILCLLGYIGVWFLGNFVPQIHAQSSLFYILSLSIVFNSIGVNWFYQGIEDFKFITVRALIIRTLAALSLFIFVKNRSGLLIYGLITVGSTVGNNFLNFIHLGKYIRFKDHVLRELNITTHIKPAISVFVLSLIISLYIQLNSVMLGIMAGDDAVGYFTAGTKISHIGLTIISSLGTVLLPRCAHLYKSGDLETFRSIITKSLNLTLALSLPMTVGFMILASPITLLFCGNNYSEAVPILFLNAPVIIFISLTNVMGVQILYPMDKIKIVIWSVSVGAFLNLILNIYLIPSYGALGAAIATFFAELGVLLYQLIAGAKYYPFKLSAIINYKYIISSLLMGTGVFLASYGFSSNIMKLIIGTGIGIIIYLICLLLAKDSLILETIQFIRKRITYAT